MALLELKNLTKAFGGLLAVNDVSFQVEKGEIVGLIGPNGSGKTTTFNCINQFFPVTSGDILFKGKSIIGPNGSGKSSLLKLLGLVLIGFSFLLFKDAVNYFHF